MERRPVILILGEEIPPCTGGVAQWGYWLALKLAARGFEPVYAARDDFMGPPETYAGKFTVHPIAARRWRHRKDLHILAALRSAWRRWRPAAVLCLTCSVARMPLLMRPFTRWKVVVLAHGIEVTKNSGHLRRHLALRWVFGGADLVFAVSRYTRERVLDAGIAADKVQVLPCAVDPGFFRPRDGERVRSRLGLMGRPVVLSISRLVRSKGHDLVIRGMAEVVRRIPEAVYLVAGTGKGPYIDELLALADTSGVSHAVRLLGHVETDDLPGLYSASDVYVMPSRPLEGNRNYEGFGITYLEANACGVPVIGADTGGVADAIVDGRTGYLVPPNDVPALADRLHRLLADPVLARRLGAAGRERVLSELTWDHVADRFLEALRSAGVAPGPRPARP